MNESIHQFGTDRHLVGIYHRPVDDTGDKPTIVTWNTGISHRIGPYRIFTTLARRLQAQNYPVFRFDLSLLGDSDSRSDQLSEQQRNNEDIHEALEFLTQTFGAKSFILVGICSGAVDAHHAAVRHPGVVGLCMVDTYVYPTRDYYFHYYQKRVWNPRGWKRFFARKLRRSTNDPTEDQFEGVYPNRNVVASELQTLVDRGVKLLVIYTGGYDYLYSYRDQFYDMFAKVDFKGQLVLEQHPRADHLFMLLEHRDQFFQSLERWLQLQESMDKANIKLPIPGTTTTPNHLIDLISHWEATAPGEHTAISDQGQLWSYQDLKRASTNLAGRLQEQGIRPGERVAVCLPRSPELIQSLIAILKCGACYVPLDQHDPDERLAMILDDARPQLLLTTQAQRERLAKLTDPELVLCLEDRASSDEQSPTFHPVNIEAETLGYIIYTSGSTGKPKGVAMPQRALAHLIDWQTSTYPAAECTLQFTPISFDVSFQEIFTTLYEQKTLVLIGERDRLDPERLLNIIAQKHINRLFLPFIALQYLAAAAIRHNLYPAGLKDVFTAGEQLKVTPALKQWFAQMPEARLHNHYGPSETHVITAYTLPQDPTQWLDLPPIGRPIDDCKIMICDDQLKPVPPGELGELLVSGPCLARGYWQNPEQTQSSFIQTGSPRQRFYRTGDYVQLDQNGELLFEGRRDRQIKIRGHRVEISAIEAALNQLPNVAQAACEVHDPSSTDRELVAFIVPETTNQSAYQDWRQELKEILPPAMIPRQFHVLNDMLRTPSGKLDRQKLLATLASNPSVPADPQPSANTTAHTISLAHITATFAEVLGEPKFPSSGHFFEHGGHSLLAIKLITILNEQWDLPLSVVDLFDRPSPEQIWQLVAPSPESQKPNQALATHSAQALNSTGHEAEPIAIIGMAGRFPGASSTEELWQLLHAGQDGIRFFTPDELDRQIDPNLKNDPQYVAARGILERYAEFDRNFFHVPALEAALIDPQQRMLLELAWQALEDAGYPAPMLTSPTGVFVGVNHNSYYLNNVVNNPELMDRVGSFQAMLANDKDFAATRIAYKLNLTGPALSIHTACSTSLVTVIEAVHSLRRGDCHLALAGGGSIQSPVCAGHLYTEGGILSKDGQCRPFDQQATGTLFSDGGGLVVLKPLSAAQRDQDRIYAVIHGVGMNNDGAVKASFSSPSVRGQQAAIRRAHQDASITAERIRYVECHGTATPIGDPIEVEALRRAFQESMPTTESHFCHIGSIKGNLGHLTAGAGIAGLIKVALACHKAELPPSIHIREANSKLQLTGSPFTLQRQLGPWPAPQGERWAGVSSFGVGGTNAHLVLCDPPPQSRPAPSPESPSLAVIGVSGFDEAACKRTQQQLCESWPQDPDHLVNLAYTLLARRWPFKHRSFTLQTTPPDANAKWLSGEAFTTFKTVWTLPGQGSQTSGMAQGLWHNAPQFREILHTGCTQIKHDHGLDLLPLLLENSDQDQQLQQTQYAQPALFLFQYALGRQLQDWGLQPDVLIGHSIGEIAAAALSGVLSFPDALHLVATRGRLMQALPPGAMMQINLSYDQWDAAAFPELDCAAINGVDRIVLAGPPEAITEAQSKLTSQSIDCRRLKTSHAFHSRMMEPMLEDFRNAIADCQFDSPNIPIISTSRTATSANGSPNRWGADYWANHIRQCVRFAPALQAYLNDQTDTAIICLELGPGRVLSSLSQPLFQRRHEQVAVALQAPRKTADHSPTDPTSCASNQWQALLKGLGQYWLKGGRLNWSQIPGHRGRHVSAPTYPFGGERYWLEPATQPRPSELSVASKPAASSIQGDTVMTDHWQQTILQRLKDLLSDITGIHADEIASEADFFELGLDSLFLTQFANRLKREFAVNISFRQLSSELARIDQLAEYLAQNTDAPPSSVTAEAADAPPPQASPLMSASTNQAGTKQPQPTSARPQTGSGNSLEAIVQQQLELMSQQINLLQQGKVSSPMTRPPAPASQVHASPTQALTHPANQDDRNFGPQTRIHRGKASLSADQEDYLRQVIQRFNAKTAASKASTAKNRAHLADPRTVNGFQPWLKEAVYPLVAHEAKGPRFWDLDGNAYYDLLAGYGSNMFGWQAPFIQQAIADQLDRGMPIGPQFELVGETSELAATMVGHDRVAWCNTGSEAVLAALRIARTVTGRHKVVVFDGAYHGLFDEVIVRAGRNGKSTPAAPGINPSSVENMIVLPYDSTESLAQIEAYRDEIAAILVEPIQSRHPACQPISFLRQLQQLTRDLGLLLIFDEVITGFRCHPAGFQGYSGIKADLATYGKVLGGGMPVGLVAGRQELMDVLDGGLWQYGDQSLPEAGVTYFAGTFVRHPLAIRCAHAVLKHLNDQGESLHDQLNDSATRFATTINQIIAEYGAPLHLETFGSLMMLRRLHCENTRSSTAFDQLIDLWLKDRGVHLSWGYPCFLTTVHTMEDEQHCATAFADSLDDLINHGFLERTSQNTTQPISQPTLQTSRQQQTQDEETEPQREPAPQPYLPHGWQPQPAPNARLGRDQTGQPAWFIPDPDRPGAYCQLVAKDGS